MAGSDEQFENPWAREHVQFERTYFAENEGEMFGALNEARMAEAEGSIPCGWCEQPAWYKPSVGAFICPSCGAMRIPRADGVVWTLNGEKRAEKPAGG